MFRTRKFTLSARSVAILGALAFASLLPASSITPVFDETLDLDVGDYGLGLVIRPGPDGPQSILLIARSALFTSPLYSAGGFGLSKVQLYDPEAVGVRTNSQSAVSAIPNDPDHLLFFGGPTLSQAALYTYSIVPEAQTNVTVSGFAPFGNKSLAIDADGAVFVSSPSGIFKYADASTGTPSLNFGTSGPGALSSTFALAIGDDGQLYAMDTSQNRVVRFNPTDGSYEGEFALTGTTDPRALTIGPNGRLYTADGNGGGEVYDEATGFLLDTFSSPAINPVENGVTTSIAVDGQGYVYLMDTATGLHVFSDPDSITDSTAPEPSTFALFTGAFLIAAAVRHRRSVQAGGA